ncbi:MAG: SMC family ATPase [Candidatus Altiarchaeota archaeon]
MMLRTLALENWACHSNLDVDLSRGLEISGRNGTGKSSILSAIRFAFAESARGYSGKIKNGARKSIVVLEFEKDESIYRVEKQLFLDKPSSAELTVNGTIVADNPSSAYVALSDVLDERIFDKLLYVAQGQLSSIITELSQKGGKAELDSLFGLDRLEQIYEKTREDIKEAQGRLEVYGKQLSKYSNVEGEEFTKQFNEVQGQQKRLVTEKKRSDNEVLEFDKKYLKIEKEVKELEQAKGSNELLEKDISAAEIELANISGELAVITEKLAYITKKETEKTDLDEEVIKFSKYVAIQEKLRELEKVSEKLRGLDDVTEIAAKLEKLKTKLSEKNKIEEKEKALKESLERVKREETALATKLGQQESYLNELSGLSDASKCPRCGQKLTEEHLSEERKSTIEIISDHKKQIGKISAEVSKKGEIYSNAQKELSELSGFEAETKLLSETYKKKSHELEVAKRRESELNLELKTKGYLGESQIEVSAQVTKHSELQGRIQMITKEISVKPEVQQKSESSKARISKLKEELEGKKSLLKKSVFDKETYEKKRIERDKTREEVFRCKSENEKLGFELKEVVQKIDSFEQQKKNLAEAKAQRDEAQKKTNLLKQAREVFHTNKGLPKYLRERYLAKLNELLAYFFSTINQNPSYQSVSFSEDYELEIATTQGKLSLSQLSGGEAVQLALALRLALVELLSPIRLLILDEPFGSLDKEHRELLGDALNKVAEQGQLILVTHIDVDNLQLPEKLVLGGY